MLKHMRIPAIAVMALVAFPAASAEVSTTVSLLNEDGTIGAAIGKVYFKDTEKGVEVRPRLTGLPPGDHGFHVHEKRSCEAVTKDGKTVPGLAAGGHYDPKHTGTHTGPMGKGHLGDLPVLKVGPDGKTQGAMTAPQLKTSDLKGRALVIHAGGDNYSDSPKPLGGGGARIACGTF